MDQFTHASATARCPHRAERERAEPLTAPPTADNRCIQSVLDASPTRWHLAHDLGQGRR